MAIMGSAHIVMRALTDRVDSDIRRGFSGSNLSGSNAAASKAGRNMGNTFGNAFRNSNSSTMLGKLTDALITLGQQSRGTYEAFRSFMRMNYTVGTAVQVLISSIFALLGGLAAIASTAVGAAGSLIVLANGGFALAAGMIAAKLALGGVGKALSALSRQTGSAVSNASQVQQAEQNLALTIERNRESLVDANNAVRDAQLSLNEALLAGKEQIQQIGFEAEDAALSEKKAALELEKARETLARVQDLPPNSRARREAELAFQEAELNLRKAKDKSADLNKEQDRLAKTGVAGTDVVINATKRLQEAETQKAKVILEGIRAEIAARQALQDAVASTGSGGGADPLAGLNQYQREFVQFLIGLKPLYKEIQLAASEAFLPPLQQAIQLIADKAFPTIKQGITEVAAAMGIASISMAQAITDATNLANLGKVFTSSATIIKGLGTTLGNVWGSALSVLVAASPLAERFVKHLENVTAKFDAWAKSDIGQAKMVNFFTLSGNAAADFGKVLGNTFAGIGGFVMANLGPGTGGQYLLDWLKTATQKFRDLDSNAAKADGLKQYFLGAAINTQKMMSSIGALLSELIKLGDNKAIGQTFDILKGGAPAVGVILKNAVEAGPALAEVVTLLTQTLALLASSTQVEYFFLPLKIALEGVKAFLEQAWVQAVMRALDPIIGFLAGVGVLASMLAVLGKILIFVAARALAPLVAMFGSFMALPVLGVIIGLAAAFIYLYKTSEDFRNSFQNAFEGVSDALAGVGARVSEIARLVSGPIGDAFSKLMGVVGTLLVSLLQLVAAFVSGLAPIIGEIVAIFVMIVPPIIDVFSTIVTMIIPILNQLTGMFNTVFGGLADGVFGQISPIIKTITTVLESFASIFAWVLSAVNTLLVAITPVLVQLVGFVTEFVSALLSGIDQIIGPLTGALTAIFSQLGPIIQGLMGIVGSFISAVIPMVVSVVTTIFDVISQVLTAITPLIYTVMGAITQIITVLAPIFSEVFSIVGGAITEIVSLIGPIVTQLIDDIIPIVDTLIGVLMPAIQDTFGLLIPLLEGIFSALGPVLDTIGPLLSAALSVVGPLISGLVPIISTLIELVVSALMTTMPLLSGFIVQVVDAISAILTALAPIIPPLMDAINQVIQALMPLIPVIIGAILPVIMSLITVILDVVVALVQSLAPAIGPILTLFAELVTAIMPLVVTIVQSLMPVFLGLLPIILQLIEAFIPVVSLILDGLIPVIVKLVESFGPLITTMIEQLVPVLVQLFDTFAPFISMFIESLIPAIMTVATAFLPLIQNIFPVLIDLINFLMPIIKFLIDLFVFGLKSAILVIIGVIQLLTGNFEGFGKTFQDIFEHVKSFGKTIVNDIIGIFEGMINFVIDGINRMIDFINNIKVTVPDWIKDLLGMKSNTFGFNLPSISHVSIPRLAKGGVVNPTAGGTMAVIGEAGKPERIEPLDPNGLSKRDKAMIKLLAGPQGGAGTINITVNPSPGMDEQALAEAISRELAFKMRMGSV